jgi:hypothetical protein
MTHRRYRAATAAPRPRGREAMARAAAVAADTNGTDHCLGPLVLIAIFSL